VTEQAAGERGCTKLRVDGKPCRGKALPGLDVCSFHARLEADPDAARIAGKRDAKAKREKPKGSTFEEELQHELDQPGQARKLLASGAQGFKLASDILQRRRDRTEVEANRGAVGPVRDEDGRPIVGFQDLVAYAVRQDRAGNRMSALLFGVELPEDVKDAILEADDRRRGVRPATDEERSPVSSPSGLTSSTLPASSTYA
jgi:hypothetical protein